MTHLFNKLFNVRADEWPRLLLLYLMALVALTGINWGETIVIAAFLQQIGVNFLPVAIIASAALSIVAIFVYTAFADRVANDKLLIAILGVSVVAIAIGLVLLGWGLVIIAYPLLYLVLNVPLTDLYNVHWATYTNSFYDTRSAKRVIPVLGTSTRVAGIIAGLTMPLLNRLLDPGPIITIWLGTLVFMALVAWLMPRILKGDKAAGSPSDHVSGSPATAKGKDQQSYIDNLREGYRYVFQSPFLRWLALSTLASAMLLVVINYQTSAILLDQLKTTKDISSFIGLVSGVTNLIILPIQLFLLSRLIGWLGLGNAHLIYPAGMTAVGGGLIFAPNLFSAALGYFGRTTFRTAFRNTTENLLYNAVPLRVKGRARAFIGGLLLPAGSIVGGLLLLTPLIGAAWFLPALIGTLALAYLLASIATRRQYGRALIALLEQEDFSSLRAQDTSELSVTDPATLDLLKRKLAESTSPELTTFIAQIISEVGGSEAVPILGQTAKASPDARVRAAILDILVAADMRSAEVRRLYVDFLTDTDGRVRQAAIAGLEQMTSPQDEQFLAMAHAMLSDPDIETRTQVLPILLRSNDASHRTAAVQTLDGILNNPNAHERACGIRVLAQVGGARSAHDLLDFLADPADEVRLEAALAVEVLSHDTLPDDAKTALLDRMPRLLNDPIARVRQATLSILGHLGGQESYEAMVGALADASPQVRETAIDTLVQIGKSVIPLVHQRLNAADPQVGRMASVVLSRINRREFGGLVDAQITGNLLTIYRNYNRLEALSPCAACSGVAILQSMFREQNRQLTGEIFYLLAAIHDSDGVKVVAESIGSESERVRANAIEALESLTTPQTAALIAPLCEPEPLLAQLLNLSKDTWDMQIPSTTKVIQQLAADPDDPWVRAIMTFALGEIGATLPPQEKQATQERPQVRRPRADLLGLLAGDSPVSAPQPADAAKTPGTPRSPLTLSEIQALLNNSSADPTVDVRLAAQSAARIMAGTYLKDIGRQEKNMLSTLEKLVFLKEVPFFQSMTVNQLKALAAVCEEEWFAEDTHIFEQGDPGGALYVVVDGRVGIEQEKRKGSFVQTATIGPHSYFGEMSLFDDSPRSTGAVALRDTMTLQLRREHLIELARQNPDMSLRLIDVLSQRLREANDRIAELTRSRPRELNKLYDALEN